MLFGPLHAPGSGCGGVRVLKRGAFRKYIFLNVYWPASVLVSVVRLISFISTPDVLSVRLLLLLH